MLILKLINDKTMTQTPPNAVPVLLENPAFSKLFYKKQISFLDKAELIREYESVRDLAYITSGDWYKKLCIVETELLERGFSAVIV
jgi:hypothetical protein